MRDIVALWNTASGELHCPLRDGCRAFAFSPNGQLLCYASEEEDLLVLWHVGTDTYRNLDGRRGEATAVAFSADGQRIASLWRGGSVVLWHVQTRMPYATLDGDMWLAGPIALSPTGALLAYVNLRLPPKIVIWDLESMRVLREVDRPHFINQMAFAADGTYLETDRGPIALDDDAGFKALRHGPYLLSTEYQWLTCNGKRLLWLPPVYRPACVAVCGRSIALGLRSGNALFLTFDFSSGFPWDEE
jgi:hypothetical protein